MCDYVCDEDTSEMRNDASRCEEFVQLCAALKAFVGINVTLPDSSSLFELFGKVGSKCFYCVLVCRFGITHWSRSTKLLNARSPGFNSRCWKPISVYNQPPRSTQPGHPSVGRRNEYQPKGGDALRLGCKGNCGSFVGGRYNCVIPLLSQAISEHFRNEFVIKQCTVQIDVTLLTLLYYVFVVCVKQADCVCDVIYDLHISMRSLLHTFRSLHYPLMLRVRSGAVRIGPTPFPGWR